MATASVPAVNTALSARRRGRVNTTLPKTIPAPHDASNAPGRSGLRSRRRYVEDESRGDDDRDRVEREDHRRPDGGAQNSGDDRAECRGRRPATVETPIRAAARLVICRTLRNDHSQKRFGRNSCDPIDCTEDQNRDQNGMEDENRQTAGRNRLK
jgi:hypothetical protein